MREVHFFTGKLQEGFQGQRLRALPVVKGRLEITLGFRAMGVSQKMQFVSRAGTK